MPHRIVSCIALAIAMLLPPCLPRALAGSFGVAPIRLELDRNAKTGLINVTNDDERKLFFQAKLYEWTQDEKGEDVYAESSDLVFFPQIFTVEPKQKRAIRVGVKAPPAASEKAYRLFIEEMPDPAEAAAAGAQVAVRLRFGVPIFHWNGAPQAKLDATAAAGAGEARLVVRNSGERQLRLEEILLLQGDRLVAKAAGWYVFPAATRTFAVPVPREACPLQGTLEMRATGEGKGVAAKLEATAGLCPS